MTNTKTGLAFHDTCRGHFLAGAITEKDGGTIILQRDRKNEDPFIFRPCTLEMYRKKYYKMCGNGKAIAEMCTSTDDLWEYYCRLYQRGEFDTYYSKGKEDVFMKKALIASLVIGSCLFLPVVHAAGYTDNVEEASKSPMNVGMVYLDMPLSECNYFQQLMRQYSPSWSHQDFPIGRMYTQLTSSYKETLMIEKGTDSVRAITYRLDTKTKTDADAAFKTLVQRMKKQLKNVPEEDTEIEVDHAYWHLKDKKADIQVSITPSTYDKTYAYTVRIDRRLENPNHHQLSDTQFQKVLTYLSGDWYDEKGNKAVSIENGQLNDKPIIAAFDLAGATGHAAATYRVKENGTYHDYHMSLRGEGIHKTLIVDKKSYRKTPTPQYGETVGGLYLGMYEEDVCKC